MLFSKEITLTTSTPATASNDTDIVPANLATQMQAASKQASKLLKSLSHPDRLLLLCQLTQGEYCVGDLEQLVGVGQPSLSQQLGILRKDELVATRREGKQIYYSIASDDALAVLQLLYQRFCAPAE
ncbi:ArsR/SmtB family transcription factor [Psychrobacter sp. DM4]|uniref:ArsR/SmtB family transcription factor n=1 Tax=Psychrobacter sp. DM4 TaxID=3440637 RepID=UPI003F4F9DC5